MTPSNYKVLIVEDDPDIQRLYLIKLELEGFVVQTAGDGYEGFRIAEQFVPDIILVDLLMPRLNGTDMLQKIREQEWGSIFRIIVLTNISRSEAPQVLRFLNVDRYIVKAHYTPKQVVEIVREVLEDN